MLVGGTITSSISQSFNLYVIHLLSSLILIQVIEEAGFFVTFDLDPPKPKSKEEKKQQQQEKTRAGQAKTGNAGSQAKGKDAKVPAK